MEHKFDIKELEYKPVARKPDSTIIKICKKKKVVDEVFPEEGIENIYDPGPLIIDKLDDKIIDRNDVLKRLNKLFNKQEVEDLNEIFNKKKEEDVAIAEKDAEKDAEKKEEKKTPVKNGSNSSAVSSVSTVSSGSTTSVSRKKKEKSATLTKSSAPKRKVAVVVEEKEDDE
mgnify:CR=1 FL=1